MKETNHSGFELIFLYISATKHAVDAITTALRFELVDTPIRVSQICPGLVNTEFSTVRFRGDKEKADNVYKGMQPLVAQDIGNAREVQFNTLHYIICRG